jgi:hypothetical protein
MENIRHSKYFQRILFLKIQILPMEFIGGLGLGEDDS